MRQCLGAYCQEELGNANTAIAYHARRIIALQEASLPYAVGNEALRILIKPSWLAACMHLPHCFPPA